MPVVAVATITPKPEHRDEVLAAFQAAVPAVHAEDGCELYALHQSKDAFVLVEQWADAEAMKAHGSGESLRTLHAAIDGKLAEPLDLTLLQPVPCGTPEKGQLA